MKDEKDKNIFFEQFLKENVEIILDNQMHYTGKLLSYGNEYLKLFDKYNNTVFIVIEKVASIRLKEGGI